VDVSELKGMLAPAPRRLSLKQIDNAIRKRHRVENAMRKRHNA
jgi:hypothetical protein